MRFALILLCAALASCATAHPSPADVDAYMRPLADSQEFAGVVLIARGEHIVFERAYGLADVETGAPMQTDTPFIIASLSKPFTAALVGRLIAQGRIAASDPLSRFLPDFPRADEITIEMLLLHRSGVADPSTFTDADALRNTELTLDHQIARIAAHPFAFDPGAQEAYNNSGYVLLARVVEIVTGQPFAEALRAEVLAPIGATHTGALYAGGPPANLPRSYTIAPPPERLRQAPAGVHPSQNVGAGGMYATARDLLSFMRASDGGALDITGLEHAYGWQTHERRGRRSFEQTGAIRGYVVGMAFYPEEDLTIVVLSNILSGDVFEHALPDLGALALGEPAPAR